MKLVSLLVAAWLLVAAPAHAQRADSRSAKELVTKGTRLYEQKKYVEAAEMLEKANELAPNPTLLFNIARAYDQAGRAREAITYYEQYTVDGEDAQLRKRARSAVDRLRLQQQREEATAVQAEAERKRLREETEAAERRVEEEREAAHQADAANRRRLDAAYRDTMSSRQRTRITSFALGGLAVAGLATGVIFGVQASGARAQFNTAQTVEAKLAARDTVRSRALVADIGYGVGIVSAVAAVLLYPRQPAPVPGEARLISAPVGSGAGVEVSF